MKKRYLLCSIIISSLLGISPAPAGVYDVTDPRPPLNFTSGAQFNPEDTGVCNTNQYPYNGSPDERVGVADTCPDQYGDHYCYTSCHANNGYVHDGSCGCYPQDCSGYPSETAEIPGCLGVDSCTPPQGETRYKCVECNPQGWESDGNGGCQPLVCDNNDFPYHDTDPDWRPTVCKGEPLVCYAGDDTYYGCEECNPGYIQDHGLCDIITCGQDFNLDACPEHGICTPCQSGSNPEKYKLTGCEEGYSLNKKGDAPSTCEISCNVGDIYYSDDTCSSTYDSSKTAIGIVFDDENLQAMALTTGKASNNRNGLVWQKSYTNVNIPELQDYSNSTAALKDMNGKMNTDIILAYANSSGKEYPAVQYCHDLTIGGKEWYLPSAGQLQKITNNRTKITPAITATGGDRVEGSSWSSTEYNDGSAYFCNGYDVPTSTNTKPCTNTNSKRSEYGVRCVFQY